MADLSNITNALAAIDTTPEPTTETPVVLGKLREVDYECMKLKLAGHTTKDIAQKMRCDRTTVYRRCQAVENEFMEGLSGLSAMNLISATLQTLQDIYQKAMREYESAKGSGRLRDMALNTARRAANDQMKLYLECGLVERAPERLFQQIFSFKPADLDKEAHGPINHEEAVNQLLDTLKKGRMLS